jgi:hypothetical protein
VNLENYSFPVFPIHKELEVFSIRVPIIPLLLLFVTI